MVFVPQRLAYLKVSILTGLVQLASYLVASYQFTPQNVLTRFPVARFSAVLFLFAFTLSHFLSPACKALH